MEGSTGGPRVIDLPEAARLLSLPEEGVEALASAGYLRPADPAGRRFVMGDVKAFLARVTDDGGQDVFSEDPHRVDPQALLDALDGRAEEMARRAFDIFQTVFAEATAWPLSDQARFIEQSRRRFEAILAVTAHGDDELLATELEEVGATAAWAGSSLPQLLVVLRISHDLVVQTAVEVAEERGRHWGLALSLLLTRVLPAMDRLTDAIARGYWEAVVGREEEARARHESVVEAASDGIYELDLDGCIKYANPSLAVILGLRLDELEGERLIDVLEPAGDRSAVAALATDGEAKRVELEILRGDGVRRSLDFLVVARYEGDTVAGYQGIVRDLSAATEMEAQKNELLRLLMSDLRQPLVTILGLGATLEDIAGELPAASVAGIGQSIRQQAERLSRLADDLDVASRIEAQALLVSGRPIPLATTVRNGLFSVPASTEVTVEVDEDLVVLADPRRLEQVVANLVENALAHGAAPVRVLAEAGTGSVVVSIIDRGPGVHDDAVPHLFNGLRPTERWASGLSLVRGLVEAMGGRAWYERADGGGASFRFTLPTPMSHQGRPG